MKTKQIVELLNQSRERRSATIDNAKILYDSCYEKITNYTGNSDERWSSMKEEQDKILFVMTWQDSLYNLARVLKEVFKNLNISNFDLENIKYGARKNERTKKGRKDVYILTENNKKFREVFYKTLKSMGGN